MSFKVNNQLCSTCIFSKRSPISPERLEQLKDQWQELEAVQECHSATIKDERVACRGHYEAARRGDLPYEALENAAREGLGLTGLSVPDLMQICERLALVEFIKIEED